MATPVTSTKRPGRGWYAIAAALAAVAVVIGTVLAIWVMRALVGYDVTPFREGEPVTIVLHDRSEAIWVTPELLAATCHTIDGQQDAFEPGSTDQMMISDRDFKWVRVGIVKGAPGSEHTLVCEGQGQVFGHAPNPRMGRYVAVGVTGGVIAGMFGIAAFAIVLVVAIKRNRRPV